MSGWVFLLLAVITVACAITLPRGKRMAVGVPVVAVAGVVVVLVNHGGDVVDEDRQRTNAEAFRSHCGAADRLSLAGQSDAAKEELKAALKLPFPTTEPAAEQACRNASARIAATTPTTTTTTTSVILKTGNEVTTTTTGVPVSLPTSVPKDVPVSDAVEAGGEDYVEDVVHAIAGDDRPLEVDGWGWLVIGLVVLAALVVWTRAVFWFARRWQVPSVQVADIVDGSGETTPVTALTAEFRRRLFVVYLRPPSLPESTVSEDVIGLVEESGVTGAKVVAGFLAVMRAAFGAGNTVSVKGTVVLTDSLCQLTVEVIDQRPGRVLLIDVASHPQQDVALNRAVIIVEQAVADARPRTRVPPWEVFSVEAQLAYQRALVAEQRLAEVTAP